MNIIDFWKSEVYRWADDSGFDKEAFLKALSEEVPDWKEQIRDKSIWPDLKPQSNALHEVEMMKIMIEELGTKFACYFIETRIEPIYGRARMAAIDYCLEHAENEWDSYSDEVKREVHIAQRVHDTSSKNGGYITTEDFINLVKEMFPPEDYYDDPADETE